MIGGVLVTKTSTGSHFLEDIRVSVCHGGDTFISAENYLNSADLHRAINSKIITVLVNTLAEVPKLPAITMPDESLRHENNLLRDALTKQSKQNAELQNSMVILQEQMTALLGVVSKAQPTQVTYVTSAPAEVRAPNLPVSEDIPIFIPTDLVPTDADVKISYSDSHTTEDSSTETLSQLRKVRKKS